MKTASLEPTRQLWQGRLFRFAPYIFGAIILIIIVPFLPRHVQSIIPKVLIFAIFGMSLDIMLGYCGLYSLGHSAFFGTAGYTVGLLITRYGIESFWIVAPCAILVAMVIAAFFGVIALRAASLYFILVTIAMGQLLWSVAMKWHSFTGGSDGLAGIPPPDLGLPWLSWGSINFYYFVFLVFIICFFLMYRFVKSPFGHALQGIRDAERRMRALGYNIWFYKWVAFLVSSVFAAVAGILFVYYTGYVGPTYISFTISGLALMVCIIGGLGTLWGSLIGAMVIVLMEYFSSIYFPMRWPLILGCMFIASVMFLRGGIGIHLLRFWRRLCYGSIKG